MSKPDTAAEELPLNKIEAIITDHNKAMRTDIASEITGGTRSKAITDVITVKALSQLITSYTKQRELALLERLEKAGRGKVIPDTKEGWESFAKSLISAILKEKESKYE